MKMTIMKIAKFNIGQPVRHRAFDFGGIVTDIDPVFANTEAWWDAIPQENRPRRDQPFYRLLVEIDGVESEAYVSEQNLLADTDGRYTVAAQAGQAGGEGLEHALLH